MDRFFSNNGVLSKFIDNFQYRNVQKIMAEAVEQALVGNEKLVIEAGTGTGKTFAYLVPALLSDKKVIISTGTKNLQEQLFYRDIPVIRKALNCSKNIVLLKGRANYLCQYRLHQSLQDRRFFHKKSLLELQSIRQWSMVTNYGDISEISDVQEGSSIWPNVTSTTHNCLGHDCPFIKKCHVLKVRQAAQKADIVVINHHLFFADLVLKEEGFGDLLPGANGLIFDESHQLSETAAQFFGHRLTSRQLFELAHDIQKEYLSIARDTASLDDTSKFLEKITADVRIAFGDGQRRQAWQQISNCEVLQKALQSLKEGLEKVSDELKTFSDRSHGLESCCKRCLDIKAKLELLLDNNDCEYIYWFETFQKHFHLNATPICVAKEFLNHMSRYPCCWIFTSATIAINSNFDYFCEQLGLDDAKTICLNSPFNYQEQAILYLPRRLPNPNSDDHVRALIDMVIPILRASRGRAFLLFTSFKALYKAEQLLSGLLPYKLFVQGCKPKSILLNEFQKDGNGILLGTNSFWQGVDVRGSALSCVIIDKLPFASPGEPVLQARLAKLREQGKNPFKVHQLPQAILSLKQGVGRLIRDINDKGVLIICDPRLRQRDYGRLFLDALPNMCRTLELQHILEFLKTM